MSTEFPEGYEARYRPFTEFRVEGDENGMTVRGHAALFDDPYDLGPFEERIAPGAFDDAIEEDDVRALWNHNPDHPLGRLKSGTLRLSTDEKGLVSEIDLPTSATVVREAIERGDVDQMSFAFNVLSETWDEREDDKPMRTLERVQLWDVSPVTYPANPNTDIGMRSLEKAMERAQATVTEGSGESTTDTVDLTDEGEGDEVEEILDNLTPRQRQLAANDAWLVAQD